MTRAYIIILIVSLSLLFSCSKEEPTNQGRTSACWVYAMCACIEHEAHRVGDSVVLSRQWLLARELEEQTLGDEDIAIRNVGPEALRLIDKYGLVPYSFERSHINNGSVLEKKIRLLREQCDKKEELYSRLKDLLPRFTVVNYDPFVTDAVGSFYYYSMRYTPQQFAESVMYRIHYDWYAHDDDRKRGERFVLDDPDNRRGYEYINASYEEMYDKVVSSVREGHAVYWEYGENHASGHAMAIVALRKSKKGVGEDLVCQNSYGKEWGNNGRCVVTPQFFLTHTSNIGVCR